MEKKIVLQLGMKKLSDGIRNLLLIQDYFCFLDCTFISLHGVEQDFESIASFFINRKHSYKPALQFL